MSLHHNRLEPGFLQCLQHRQKNQLPAVIASDRFRAAFRMRHHTKYFAYRTWFLAVTVDDVDLGAQSP
jgi:hypothetical protein